jgi:uncharacterized protein with HEPN domain
MKDDRDYLDHILEAGRRVLEYTRNGRTSFEADRMTQDAVIRNLEVIGEAVKNVSEALRQQYPVVPWKRIAGLRDTLIHRYFRIDFDLVWDIVEVHLPELMAQVNAIQTKLNAPPDNTSRHASS